MLSQNPDAILRRILAVKRTISSKIEKEQDKEELQILREDISSIDNLVDDLSEYTKSVFVDEEKNRNLERFKEECKSTEEYQYKFEEIEKTRKSRHDKLIMSIKLADKICEIYGEEPIYGELGEYKNDVSGLMGSENRKNPGVVEKRHEIAKWGFDLVISCVAGMALEKDSLRNYEKDNDTFLNIANLMSKAGVKGIMRRVVGSDSNDYR